MKKIITAIGNINLNMELKKDSYFDVLSQDIQYQEGIFEILEQRNDINFLVVSQNIPGELDFLELVRKIIKVNSKINIYVILEEKNIKIEDELNQLKISNIFYSNQIEIKELITYIKNDKKQSEESLKEEIEKLKELILKNNLNNNEENSKEEKIQIKSSKKLRVNVKNNVPKKENKDIFSICVTGVYGSGKSITTLLIAKYFEQQKKKVLIIDADIYNQSIHTILGTKVKINNDEKILVINKQINVFSDINDFIDTDKSLKTEKFYRFIDYIKNEYDILLIDTTSNIENEYMKKLFKLCNKIIFLVEPNLSEVSKSKNLLDYYLYKLNISMEKINIIFNKTNKNMIDEGILKNLFFNIKIIGKIIYRQEYTECINRNKINILNNKKLLKSCYLNLI